MEKWKRKYKIQVPTNYKKYTSLNFSKKLKLYVLSSIKISKKKKINHLFLSKIIEKINKLFIQNENEKKYLYIDHKHQDSDIKEDLNL